MPSFVPARSASTGQRLVDPPLLYDRPMPEVAFVVSDRQHYPQRELAETLRYELELQGVPGALHTGAFPTPRTGSVNVLLDPFGYLAAEGERSLSDRGQPLGLVRDVGVFCESQPLETFDRARPYERGVSPRGRRSPRLRRRGSS